ncbi:MAG: hypothetical protein VR64_17805 [Desulfatitalea sp. BRH_c12]|nr:MAG: hypothetical protein VR64_17805 [Desulfatitalea sp. BRH_c12]
MLDIDRQLSSLGFSIPQRPINALVELSRKCGIPLPITKPHTETQHRTATFWPVTERVLSWYDQRYGDRIKMSFSPGRMAVLIEDDIWILRFPGVLGSVALTVSRNRESVRLGSEGQPAVYNVVDAVENLPRSRLPMLPDNELEHIYEKFEFGLKAFSILRGSAEHALMNSALADIAAAVEHLACEQQNFGLSKWSSLQAAEKMFKAAISLAGGSYSNTHDLAKLSKQAEATGLKGDWEVLHHHIQCSPGIRYGEEPCDRDSALIAHHAALGLSIMLHQGGARFRSNLFLQADRFPRG